MTDAVVSPIDRTARRHALQRLAATAAVPTLPTLAACGTAEVVWWPDRERKTMFARGVRRMALLNLAHPGPVQAVRPEMRYLVFEDRQPIVREFRVGPFRGTVSRTSGGWRQLLPAYDAAMRVKETLDASVQLSRALAALPQDPYGRFTQQLMQALREQGVTVASREVRDPAAPFALNLQGLPEVDAVIEQTVGFGFVRANRKQPYHPTLDVSFELRSSDPKQAALGVQQWTGSLTAGDPPRWPDLPSLLQQPREAMDALMSLAEGYAGHFASTLRDDRAWQTYDAA